MIHNPHDVRVHLEAQKGGRRTLASLDGFRHRDRASPPSMVCFTKRYHSSRQVREDLLIRLTQSIVPYELKRRATTLQWLRFQGREAPHVRSMIRRVRHTLQIADRMVDEGPRISTL